MTKQFMPDVTPAHRLQLLQENAYSHETTTYARDLSQEELDVKREQLTENLIQASNLEDDLSEIKKSFTEKLGPLKSQRKEMLQQIKMRKEEVKGTLFHLADHENGIMETFDDRGEFVSSRRLRPEEKQQKLFPLSKAQ